MHAIQTSGNCIRNITADPHAGATADEVDDPRIWAEAIRQWSTFHPEFSFLPRKFKIAVTAAPKDRAATTGLRHRPAPAPRRRRRAGLRGAGRRRPGPHALSRPDHPRAPAGPAPAVAICRRSCASTTATAGATTSGRRASRCWSPAWAPRSSPARSRRSGRRPTRPRSTCRTRSWPASAPPSRRAASRPCRRRRRPFEAAKAADPAFARFARNNVQPHKIPGYAIVDVVAEDARRDARATARPTRWTSSPTSPSATRWTRCGSPTSRT